MVETASRDEIDPSGRMPQALMLFGENGVTPVGYCLMQGDREISRGSFPTDIHAGIERYNFILQIECEARENWLKEPKNTGSSNTFRGNLEKISNAIRAYVEERIESLSPATWQAMT